MSSSAALIAMDHPDSVPPSPENVPHHPLANSPGDDGGDFEAAMQQFDAERTQRIEEEARRQQAAMEAAAEPPAVAEPPAAAEPPVIEEPNAIAEPVAANDPPNIGWGQVRCAV